MHVLDSNIFIQSHRVTYPFDVFPTFWEWLEQEFDNGHVISIDMVKEELRKGKDELTDWINDRDPSWFMPVSDKETQKHLATIATHVMESRQFRGPAKRKFLDGADPWLIAKAKADGLTVITQEKSDPQSKKKIFIPDICRTFNVECCNLVELMRILGARI